MEARKEMIAALELMPQPALFVEAGIITYQNTAACKFLLDANMPVHQIIAIGQEEYQAFTSGQLHLTVCIAGQQCACSVSKTECGEIWVLEQPIEQAQLQAMALAAQILREPLSAAMSATDQLFPSIDPDNCDSQTQAAQVNRRLFQMLRVINNMSDAVHYSQNAGQLEYVEICDLIGEIMEKASNMTADMRIHIDCELPKQPVYTLADAEKLERSIYNLLSNAIKYSPEDGSVQVRVTNSGNRLYLSVCNEGTQPIGFDLHTRYLRDPGLYDSRWGLGLGMVLVRSTAAIHGGTVLVDRPDPNTNRITMTIAIRQPVKNQLRSPILRIDYTGERDHGLIELADILPSTLYNPENIN